MPIPAGTAFGAFEILAPLGAGAMGEVYRARDTKLGRDVAIKILPPTLALDRDRVDRFEREARVLASLNHPHIAAIYGLEEADGVRALVLELVEGPTLAERVARGALPTPEALQLARQINDALDAAHAHGIIHRDLKPANIKIRTDGAVKVLDFGLAKNLMSSAPPNASSEDSAATVAATHDGVVLGSPAYMSPEQARGHVVDARTDIWAFGCVLYEMLTAKRAFGGATVADAIAGILEREPDWRALPASTPPSIRRLLSRCIVKDPRRRLHDIADARLEIDEALEGQAASTAPETRRRRTPVLFAVAGVVGILALLGSWAMFGARPRGSTVVSLSIAPPKGTTFPRDSGAPWPSISPDGRQLAFVATASGGQQRIWVRPLDSTTPRQLEGTDGAIRPFWSPDSRSLGFFANGKLARVDVDTAAVRVLADAPYMGGLAGTWGDGVILFKNVSGLHRLPAGGGAPTLVLAKTDSFDPAVPSFLPDGRRFVFTRWHSRPEESRACVGSLDSSQTTCVFNADSPVLYAAPGYLLFVRDAALMAQRFDPDRASVSGEPFTVANDPVDLFPSYAPPPFSVSDAGILAYAAAPRQPRLTWMDRSGAQLGAPLGTGNRPALSPDETRIILQRRDLRTGNTDLWLIDRARGVETRFTFNPAEDNWPAFSPDGEHVIFASGRAGRAELYLKRTNGDRVEEPLGFTGTDPDWSSDGRFILYMASAPKTGFDLWAARLDGDRKPFPVAQTEHGEREGRFSPDGRWVAYDSTESGRREIWIQPFPPTGNKRQISTSGGVSPQWRRDGKELFFVAADGVLNVVTIRSGATLDWDAPRALFQTMFTGGTYAPFAVSKDGQRFLIAVSPAIEDVTPITVVVNWMATLQK
jgi:eukaryotic-like serine/threonine-protein kinase